MATATLDDLRSLLRSDVERLTGKALRSDPLWPDEFCDNTHESAWAFVRQQWTWNESEKQEQPFPQGYGDEYLEEYCWDWEQGYGKGQLLAAEKCRRMVVSWCARALELRRMGIERSDQVLIGENYRSSAKHVWRLKFLYEGLRRRNPDWLLPEHDEIKQEGARQLKSFSLPNGSICNYGNGESDTFRGDGASIITMEEFGTYRYGASILAQALIIALPAPGKIGGFVNLITNTSPSVDWQAVKANAKPTQL